MFDETMDADCTDTYDDGADSDDDDDDDQESMHPEMILAQLERSGDQHIAQSRDHQRPVNK